MTANVTKQGIVWRHELDLVDTRTMADGGPVWIPAAAQYTIRVGNDDITISCWTAQALPPLGSAASVDVWVEEPGEGQ